MEATMAETRSMLTEGVIRYRVFWATSGFAATYFLINCVALLVRGSPVAAAGFLCTTAAIGAVAALTARTKRFDVGASALIAVLFVSFAVSALFEGGVSAPSLWWLSAVPILYLLAGLYVHGLIAAAVFVVFVMLLAYLQQSDALPAPVLLWPLAYANTMFAFTVAGSTAVPVVLIAASLRLRQALAQEMDDARRRAVEAGELKSRFMANMSHEIRTPLNGLIGAAELIGKDSLPEDQRRQLIHLQRESATAVLAIVNDILDWTKLSSGNTALENRPTNLRSLVFHANQLFSVGAFDKHIELTSSCTPEVPMLVLADPTRIRQVINNLVANAVKFTPEGGVHISLSVDDAAAPALPAEHAWIRIEVSDTGIGIDEAGRSHLFGAFTQADASISRRFGGTGLGLAISKELATLMGGRIEVQSQPGIGSRFTLVVPLKVELPATASPLAGDAHLIAATRTEGLALHVKALLREVGLAPVVSLRIPPPEAVTSDLRILLVDSALLPASVDEAQRALKPFIEGGVRVVIMLPVNDNEPAHHLPGTSALYKPIRRSNLRSFLENPPLPEAGASPVDRVVPPQRLRVLLAEDNLVNQTIAKAMLELLECSVTVADDGAKALAALLGGAFDLVLMDIQMPEMDGLTAVRRIREREQASEIAHMPVVAMTANTEEEFGRRYKDAGFDAYLAKPFMLGHLADAMQQAMRGSRRAPG